MALALPTSRALAGGGDEVSGRMLAAVNGMLAVIARKDDLDRRRQQAEGAVKVKAGGRCKGRPENLRRNAGIATMLGTGSPWMDIEGAFGCSRSTIARVKHRMGAAAVEA